MIDLNKRVNYFLESYMQIEGRIFNERIKVYYKLINIC